MCLIVGPIDNESKAKGSPMYSYLPKFEFHGFALQVREKPVPVGLPRLVLHGSVLQRG